MPEEEEEGDFVGGTFDVGFVETLVALGGAGPNLVLHRLVDVFLAEAFDDKKASILVFDCHIRRVNSGQMRVKLLRVIHY